MTDKTLEDKQLIESSFTNRANRLYENEVNVGVIDYAEAGAVFLDISGDLVRLYIKINAEIVEDAKFLCYGRQGSISAMSAMTILLKGKTLSQAKELTEHDILKEIEVLPKDCAELPIKTLRKAIEEYEKSKIR